MEVQIRGRATTFRDILPGTFFCALRTEKIFGLSIIDAGGAGALIFSDEQTQGGTPWAAPGGLPRDDLVSFPGAVIRADPLSVRPVGGAPPYGTIINFEDRFYMRAANGLGNYVTCNVVTGALETIPSGPLSLYPAWSIGYEIGEAFEELFSFPFPANRQA